MSRGCWIYLVEAQNGMVKIGFTSNPTVRLAFFRLHSPLLVRFIALWPGQRRDEIALHVKFDEHLSHAEWFRCEGEVAGFVAEMRGVGLASIAEWHSCIAEKREAKAARLRPLRSAGMKAAWVRAKKNPEWTGLAWREARKAKLTAEAGEAA